MNDLKHFEEEARIFQKNSNYRLLASRMGILPEVHTKQNSIEGINDIAKQLRYQGGYHQQERMIRDKRKSLDKALLYSYQGAIVKKVRQQNEDDELELIGAEDNILARALINPNKLKADYDEKIISTGFENNFKTGDIFEWVNTGSYWLIYLQEMTELAYFRANCRKCHYEISWLDEDGNQKNTYCSIRGPVETKINYIQKHQISVDIPNYSLNILMPKNKATLTYFKRYSKFYLQNLEEGDTNVCWRVEAVDSISTPGILEITAVEYYANEIEDDIAAGLVGGLKVQSIVDPNLGLGEEKIDGETFIKPKKEYTYNFIGDGDFEWNISENAPVLLQVINDHTIYIKWDKTYSGQFDISYGPYKKTVIVESLF